jgi:hypothetical protein
MNLKQIIFLYQYGHNCERGFLIWHSTSRMPLPSLRTDYRYNLSVTNGPRLTYFCAQRPAEFVLQRLFALVEHAPIIEFPRCLKCQAGLQLELLASQEPDPGIGELEALNRKLYAAMQNEVHDYRTELIGQDKPYDPILSAVEVVSDVHPMQREFSCTVSVDASPEEVFKHVTDYLRQQLGMDQKPRNCLPLPEPDRTTPALDVAHGPTIPAALTRQELRNKEDKSQAIVDNLDDFECACVRMLITEQRKIDGEKAREIRRQEEAKVGK